MAHYGNLACSLSRLLLGRHLPVLLLLKECPGLVRLLLKVRLVADELNRIDDLFIIKEHTSNFSGSLSIVGLDKGVDRVSDLLTSIIRFHVHESLHVDGRHLLLLLHDLLLLHELGLIRSHTLSCLGVLCLARLLLLRLSLLVALATLTAVVVSTSVIVKLAITTLSLVVSVVVLTVTVLALTLSLEAAILEPTL